MSYLVYNGQKLVDGGSYLTDSSSPVELTIAYNGTDQFVFKWKAPSTSTLVFHWGDGTTTYEVGQDSTLITSTSSYSSVDSYDFYIEGDVLDLTYIAINTQSFVSGDVSSWSALTSLTYIDCYSTSVTGDVSSWSALTSLTYLRCYSTSVTGDVSSWSALTSLTYLNISSTSVTFGSALAWSMTGTINMYSINNGGATSAMVDNMIESFSTCTGCTIEIAGTNAHRTAASNDDLNTLLANGNTITLNDTLSAEKITSGDFASAVPWDVTDPSWVIAAGVASYDDLNDDNAMLQVDANLVSVIAINTIYRFEFTSAATPTNAALALKNSALDVVFIAQANYTDGTTVWYFTSPADVSGGGLGIVGYQAGDPFDLDDVSLKTVTFV